jgi:hypothetical protein
VKAARGVALDAKGRVYIAVLGSDTVLRMVPPPAGAPRWGEPEAEVGKPAEDEPEPQAEMTPAGAAKPEAEATPEGAAGAGARTTPEEAPSR